MRFVSQYLLLIAGLITVSIVEADDYQLNPFHLQLSGTNSLLKKPDHDAWIKSFYQEISLKSIDERKAIKDEQGQGLTEKLRLAADEYLQLQPLRANESAQEAVDMISNAVPYSEMLQDLSEAVSILWMSGTSDLNLVAGFCGKDDFFNKFPLKYKNLAQERCRSLKEKEFQIPSGIDKIQIIGFDKIPSKLKVGRYLVHRLQAGYLSAFWLDIKEKDTLWVLLWKRNLWTAMPTEKVKLALVKSKPKYLPMKEVSLITPDHPVPILILSQERKNIGKKNFDPFNVVADAPDVSSEPSIFKSPWFWVISTSMAGLAGYIIYEGVREKEVTTP